MSRFIHGVAVNLASTVSHTRQSKKLYTDFKTEKTVDKGRKLGRGGGEESMSILNKRSNLSEKLPLVLCRSSPSVLPSL